MKLREIAERLGCRLDGDGEVEIERVAGIEDAGPGDLTFLSNPRYAAALGRTRASAVILSLDAPPAPCAMLRGETPYLTFARAVGLFNPEVPPEPGVHSLADVALSAVLGEDVSIAPFVAIGRDARIGARVVIGPHVSVGAGATIGDDSRIHAHVSIRERVVLGRRVVVQDGAVIGADGFGFAKRPDGSYEKIPQPGLVVVEDDVEIGANTTIDRPAVGETRIRAGAKIDNLVQIAHGVGVGRDTLLCAQVGIAGSATIGDRAVLAGQVGVAGHLEVGDEVVATAQTGIPNSVDAHSVVSGYPAIPNRDWLKASAVFKRLPELKKTIAELEARIERLEQALAATRRP
ncbi:MAG TPA: UDP-3-O-(3-hydroxymyristoyl)glucosamine N-acyltransferase [Vicinamibacterales bacterium]|nr:UDP-3-O-(3-hydroxymyristoyl)glucosamine N-acyltransferase [Vicinamibacterales bacterium]